MSPLTPEVLRSRTIREAILHALHGAFLGDLAIHVGVPRERILALFNDSKVDYAPEQIDVELLDMIEDGLIEQVPYDGVEALPDTSYRITSRGRDFVRGKFPWHRVDEYTGGQKP